MIMWHTISPFLFYFLVFQKSFLLLIWVISLKTRLPADERVSVREADDNDDVMRMKERWSGQAMCPLTTTTS